MISASLSLSLPRLGWKSTSTPRSLKICTAAGESASEMRTLGLDMGVILKRTETVVPALSRDPYSRWWLWVPGRASLARDDDEESYAAFGSCALVSANAQSIHCVSNATSLASTVAPHQMRRPAGASR